MLVCSEYTMDYKNIALTLLILIGLTNSAHIPEVSEQDNEGYHPETFNFDEYQKHKQQDPQQMRYQQQQIAGSLENKFNTRAGKVAENQDQSVAGSQDTSVKVPAPSVWKVVHPKFVNEKAQEEKANIVKNSLPPNSYQVSEIQDRSDRFSSENNLVAKTPKVLQQNLGGFVGNRQNTQLQALNSLLGQQPNVQLHGLKQLLNGQGPVYIHKKDHTPIKEEVVDFPNPQSRPNIKVQHNQNEMIKAIQALAQNSVSSDPNSLKSLQAQLDATASAHAEAILAQAQENALQHVQAQHAAIAKAQAQAQNAALAQIKAQNEGLNRQHVENESRKQAEVENRRQSEYQTIQVQNRQHAENEARKQAEFEGRRQAEYQAEARRQTEIANIKQAEYELRKQSELNAVRLAENEARRKAEFEAIRLIETEARRQAELEKRRHAEIEERKHAETEARRQSELEQRRQSEIQARKQAEVEARRQGELEERRHLEIEERKRAEVEARRQVELEEKRHLEIEERKHEIEARRQYELLERRDSEIEARKRADFEARRQLEHEARRQSHIEARRQSELEAQRQAEAENAAISIIENEARRQSEYEARRKAELDSKRKYQAEEEARKRAEAEEQEQERKRDEYRLKKEREQAKLRAKLSHRHEKPQEAAETQNIYYNAETPGQGVHFVNVPAYTQASVQDVKTPVYAQHQDDQAEVTKYYVPPQITVQEGKNKDGEHEVSRRESELGDVYYDVNDVSNVGDLIELSAGNNYVEGKITERNVHDVIRSDVKSNIGRNLKLDNENLVRNKREFRSRFDDVGEKISNNVHDNHNVSIGVEDTSNISKIRKVNDVIGKKSNVYITMINKLKLGSKIDVAESNNSNTDVHDNHDVAVSSDFKGEISGNHDDVNINYTKFQDSNRQNREFSSKYDDVSRDTSKDNLRDNHDYVIIGDVKSKIRINDENINVSNFKGHTILINGVNLINSDHVNSQNDVSGSKDDTTVVISDVDFNISDVINLPKLNLKFETGFDDEHVDTADYKIGDGVIDYIVKYDDTSDVENLREAYPIYDEKNLDSTDTNRRKQNFNFDFPDHDDDDGVNGYKLGVSDVKKFQRANEKVTAGHGNGKLVDGDEDFNRRKLNFNLNFPDGHDVGGDGKDDVNDYKLRDSDDNDVKNFQRANEKVTAGHSDGKLDDVGEALNRRKLNFNSIFPGGHDVDGDDNDGVNDYKLRDSDANDVRNFQRANGKATASHGNGELVDDDEDFNRRKLNFNFNFPGSHDVDGDGNDDVNDYKLRDIDANDVKNFQWANGKATAGHGDGKLDDDEDLNRRKLNFNFNFPGGHDVDGDGNDGVNDYKLRDSDSNDIKNYKRANGKATAGHGDGKLDDDEDLNRRKLNFNFNFPGGHDVDGDGNDGVNDYKLRDSDSNDIKNYKRANGKATAGHGDGKLDDDEDLNRRKLNFNLNFSGGHDVDGDGNDGVNDYKLRDSDANDVKNIQMANEKVGASHSDGKLDDVDEDLNRRKLNFNLNFSGGHDVDGDGNDGVNDYKLRDSDANDVKNIQMANEKVGASHSDGKLDDVDEDLNRRKLNFNSIFPGGHDVDGDGNDSVNDYKLRDSDANDVKNFQRANGKATSYHGNGKLVDDDEDFNRKKLNFNLNFPGSHDVDGDNDGVNDYKFRVSDANDVKNLKKATAPGYDYRKLNDDEDLNTSKINFNLNIPDVGNETHVESLSTQKLNQNYNYVNIDGNNGGYVKSLVRTKCRFNINFANYIKGLLKKRKIITAFIKDVDPRLNNRSQEFETKCSDNGGEDGKGIIDNSKFNAAFVNDVDGKIPDDHDVTVENLTASTHLEFNSSHIEWNSFNSRKRESNSPFANKRIDVEDDHNIVIQSNLEKKQHDSINVRTDGGNNNGIHIEKLEIDANFADDVASDDSDLYVESSIRSRQDFGPTYDDTIIEKQDEDNAEGVYVEDDDDDKDVGKSQALKPGYDDVTFRRKRELNANDFGNNDNKDVGRSQALKPNYSDVTFRRKRELNADDLGDNDGGKDVGRYRALEPSYNSANVSGDANVLVRRTRGLNTTYVDDVDDTGDDENDDATDDDSDVSYYIIYTGDDDSSINLGKSNNRTTFYNPIEQERRTNRDWSLSRRRMDSTSNKSSDDKEVNFNETNPDGSVLRQRMDAESKESRIAKHQIDWSNFTQARTIIDWPNLPKANFSHGITNTDGLYLSKSPKTSVETKSSNEDKENNAWSYISGPNFSYSAKTPKNKELKFDEGHLNKDRNSSLEAFVEDPLKLNRNLFMVEIASSNFSDHNKSFHPFRPNVHRTPKNNKTTLNTVDHIWSDIQLRLNKTLLNKQHQSSETFTANPSERNVDEQIKHFGDNQHNVNSKLNESLNLNWEKVDVPSSPFFYDRLPRKFDGVESKLSLSRQLLKGTPSRMNVTESDQKKISSKYSQDNHTQHQLKSLVSNQTTVTRHYHSSYNVHASNQSRFNQSRRVLNTPTLDDGGNTRKPLADHSASPTEHAPKLYSEAWKVIKSSHYLNLAGEQLAQSSRNLNLDFEAESNFKNKKNAKNSLEQNVNDTEISTQSPRLDLTDVDHPTSQIEINRKSRAAERADLIIVPLRRKKPSNKLRNQRLSSKPSTRVRSREQNHKPTHHFPSASSPKTFNYDPQNYENYESYTSSYNFEDDYQFNHTSTESYQQKNQPRNYNENDKFKNKIKPSFEPSLDDSYFPIHDHETDQIADYSHSYKTTNHDYEHDPRQYYFSIDDHHYKTNHHHESEPHDQYADYSHKSESYKTYNHGHDLDQQYFELDDHHYKMSHHHEPKTHVIRTDHNEKGFKSFDFSKLKSYFSKNNDHHLPFSTEPVVQTFHFADGEDGGLMESSAIKVEKVADKEELGKYHPAAIIIINNGGKKGDEHDKKEEHKHDKKEEHKHGDGHSHGHGHKKHRRPQRMYMRKVPSGKIHFILKKVIRRRH